VDLGSSRYGPACDTKDRAVLFSPEQRARARECVLAMARWIKRPAQQAVIAIMVSRTSRAPAPPICRLRLLEARMPARAAPFVSICAVVSLGVAACTGSAPGGPTGRNEPSASNTSSVSIPSPPFVRTCLTSVYGQLGEGWKKKSVIIGPIALVSIRSLASVSPAEFEGIGGRYFAQKVLVLVDPGTTVTLSVTPSERQYASLQYDPATFGNGGPYPMAAGNTAVTFVACKPGQSPYGQNGPTQFNGGFIVVGARCVALNINIGRVSTGRTVKFPFGRGSCR
jgi:hypothetical protein